MGLDQWLYKKTYVQNWEHQRPEERHEISVKLGGVLREDINPQKIAYIVEQAGYWRKFNALHGWIVDNCAEGNDECQEIHLTEDNLRELYETLTKVLEKVKAEQPNKKEIAELMPPTSGFFFGSTEIDEHYIAQVEKTIEIIEQALICVGSDVDYYYQASW